MEAKHQGNIEEMRQQLEELLRSTTKINQLFADYAVSEQALLESEERFRLLVEGVRDYAIFGLDVNGTIVSWNTGAQHINGYTADEAIGRHFSMFYPPEDLAANKPAWELEIAAREGRYQEEGWRLRKDGSRFWSNVLITALYDGSGVLRGFGKVTRDLTAQKDAQEALRRSEEQFGMLVAGVRDYAIFMLDTEGRIITWNKGAQMIKGYDASEIIGRHFSVFYPPAPDVLERCAGRLRAAVADGRYEEEGWRVRKDGTRFWADVVITALYDDSGVLRGFGKVTRDLTERMAAAAQKERLREQEHQLERERDARQQSEAMARMRHEFLTNAAHELRTPVTSLLGYAQLLARRMDQDNFTLERARQPLQVITEQAQRLERLTSLLLDLSWLEHGRLRLNSVPIDLRALTARVVGEFQLITQRHPIAMSNGDPAAGHGAEKAIVIAGDDLRLEQVVYNLVQNAIKYSPEGGAVTVGLTAEDGWAILRVADRGLGIPVDELESIFDRFYRASNASDEQIGGVGIGLFITRELVRLHGGTIAVESAVGSGSTFTVRLPLAQAPGESGVNS